MQKVKPVTCKSSRACKSSECNKLSTFDWLSNISPAKDQCFSEFVEVSFKNGSQKRFFRNELKLSLRENIIVAVEAITGHDIGEVTMTGPLVILQMKKKDISSNSDNINNIYRIATENDIKHWQEAKELEKTTLIKARSIANKHNLDMKIGDVYYQGDKKKITFYYTANDRVDFRDLVKTYASEFKVKIDMRQLGFRQEAGRIGGMGNCGGELCCSMWLTAFKTVSTTTAHYQKLAVSTNKLGGQCGRLKCCLNYELDTYMEALKDIPENINTIETKMGEASLIKTDILKRTMYFTYPESSTIYALPIEQVKNFTQMNKQGEKPENLQDFKVLSKKEKTNIEEITDLLNKN